MRASSLIPNNTANGDDLRLSTRTAQSVPAGSMAIRPRALVFGSHRNRGGGGAGARGGAPPSRELPSAPTVRGITKEQLKTKEGISSLLRGLLAECAGVANSRQLVAILSPFTKSWNTYWRANDVPPHVEDALETLKGCIKIVAINQDHNDATEIYDCVNAGQTLRELLDPPQDDMYAAPPPGSGLLVDTVAGGGEAPAFLLATPMWDFKAEVAGQIDLVAGVEVRVLTGVQVPPGWCRVQVGAHQGDAPESYLDIQPAAMPQEQQQLRLTGVTGVPQQAEQITSGLPLARALANAIAEPEVANNEFWLFAEAWGARYGGDSGPFLAMMATFNSCEEDMTLGPLQECMRSLANLVGFDAAPYIATLQESSFDSLHNARSESTVLVDRLEAAAWQAVETALQRTQFGSRVDAAQVEQQVAQVQQESVPLFALVGEQRAAELSALLEVFLGGLRVPPLYGGMYETQAQALIDRARLLAEDSQALPQRSHDRRTSEVKAQADVYNTPPVTRRVRSPVEDPRLAQGSPGLSRNSGAPPAEHDARLAQGGPPGIGHHVQDDRLTSGLSAAPGGADGELMEGVQYMQIAEEPDPRELAYFQPSVDYSSGTLYVFIEGATNIPKEKNKHLDSQVVLRVMHPSQLNPKTWTKGAEGTQETKVAKGGVPNPKYATEFIYGIENIDHTLFIRLNTKRGLKLKDEPAFPQVGIGLSTLVGHVQKHTFGHLSGANPVVTVITRFIPMPVPLPLYPDAAAVRIVTARRHYYPGETIKGVVCLSVRINPKAIKYFRVRVRGLSWTHSYHIERRGSKSRRVEDYETVNLFEFQSFCMGDKGRNTENAMLQPGLYSWPFQFTLKDEGLPASFNFNMHNAGARISYTIEAKLRLPSKLGSVNVKHPFTVVNAPSQAEMTGQRDQYQGEMTFAFGRNRPLLFSHQLLTAGPLRPSNEFRFKVAIQNRSKKTIKHCTMKCNVFVEATARGHTKRDSFPIINIKLEGLKLPIKAGEMKEGEFVAPLPPSLSDIHTYVGARPKVKSTCWAEVELSVRYGLKAGKTMSPTSIDCAIPSYLAPFAPPVPARRRTCELVVTQLGQSAIPFYFHLSNAMVDPGVTYV